MSEVIFKGVGTKDKPFLRSEASAVESMWSDKLTRPSCGVHPSLFALDCILVVVFTYVGGMTCVPLLSSFEAVCIFLGTGNWVSQGSGLMLLGKHSGVSQRGELVLLGRHSGGSRQSNGNSKCLPTRGAHLLYTVVLCIGFATTEETIGKYEGSLYIPPLYVKVVFHNYPAVVGKQ